MPPLVVSADAGPAVTARVRDLVATSPRAGAVVARRAYRVGAVRVDGAAVVVPLVGTKRVHVGDRTWEVPPGAVLVVHDRVALDVENLPDGDRGYLASTLAIPDRVVASVRALVDGPLRGALDERVTVCPLADVEASLVAWLRLPAEAVALEVDHALAGVAVALVRAGHPRFLVPREPSLSDRVRALVAEEPGRPWCAADVEARFHVSGATLRRRLADEGTSLRAVLVEARLHHGLGLLQSTRAPLKTVAHACGYRSLASFRAQFRARFGCEPGVVRADAVG